VILSSSQVTRKKASKIGENRDFRALTFLVSFPQEIKVELHPVYNLSNTNVKIFHTIFVKIGVLFGRGLKEGFVGFVRVLFLWSLWNF
jgi:hypothetical protein